VTSPLGPDKLLFYRMTAHERLGRLFEFHLEVLSENPAIALHDVVAQPLGVHVEPPEGTPRHFHGLVTQFRLAGTLGRLARYSATVRPWLWFLTRTADCKIFQAMTVPDIIQAVFRDLGFTDFESKLSGTYRTWDYCVQYRESDFDFVSRLMEQEGIYYYFRHEEAKHTLVLSDAIGAHEPAPGCAEVPFYPPTAHARRERDHLFEWSVFQEVQSGSYSLKDFDFEKPKANLLVVKQASPARTHPQASHEVYDYPGEYVVAADGENYAKARIEERQWQYEQVQGKGTALGLAVGSLFTLTGYDVREDQNREYLIVESTHRLQAAEYETSGAAASEVGGQCDITAIPSSQPFRTPCLTSKPTISGPQTAIVVGPSGEEIWTDKYGRVKVQFHWDRYGTSNENSSCWVRVSQLWAGKQWGGIHIPRIGHEVIVDFLEGDPDRPIITGRVYNADAMPPYALPDNQTQSGIKSRSSKQGTADNFNELRFEDLKDQEEVYFHAEKNFNRVVENNDTLKVGFEKADKGDQTIEIHNNQKLVIGNDKSADGSQTIEIWKDRTTTIKEGHETLTIKKGNRTETIETGNDSLTITKGNRTETIDKGNDSLTVSQGNQSITISQGDQTVTISAGKNVTEAGTSIELKVGQSSIKLEAAKITIKSVEIAIEGQAKLNAKSPLTEVAGDGALTLKGGIIKIN
jgi:type VI secretion system secreted protein VgrG